jgi:hypothetical protein
MDDLIFVQQCSDRLDRNEGLDDATTAKLKRIYVKHGGPSASSRICRMINDIFVRIGKQKELPPATPKVQI